MSPLMASRQEYMEEAVATYQAALDTAAARYLLARGIEEAAAVTFRLGVVRNPLPGHEHYQGNIVIPYLDKDGKALSMRFRCIQQHDCRENYHGKYMSLPDEPSRVFNISAIHQAGNVIHVTEGEFDAIVLNQIGHYAVAIPGASGWQPHHRVMLAGFSRVWVWGDPDKAGAEFAGKVTRSLVNAKQVRLTEGDVTETYLEGGQEALEELLKV